MDRNDGPEYGESRESRLRDMTDSLPKWEPYSNRSYQPEYRKRGRNRNKIMAVCAIVMAIIVAAVAVCLFIDARRREDAKVVESVPAIPSVASEEDSQHGSITMMNISESPETISEAQAVAGGYILTDVSGVIEAVLPSVVSVTSRTIVNYYGSYGGSSGYDDLWNYFFGPSFGGRGSYYQEVPGGNNPQQQSENTEEPKEIDSGLGSGTIIAQNSTELLILTSYHVVDNCSSLYVTFANENSIDGYIKSADEEKDIAIVAVPLADIDQDTLNSIKIAKICNDTPKVGEGVIVIGNALGYGISVTTGIISAVDRVIKVDGRELSVLQTDAAINSGNSGGCMLNSKGEIVGINEAKVKISYVEGMCYAIPVHDNMELIQSLLNESKPFTEENPESEATTASYGVFLGIRGRDVDESIQELYGDLPQGVYVSSVVPGSGAEAGGVITGDIIVGVNESVISTMEELQQALSSHQPGDTVTVVLLRQIGDGYQSMTVDVLLSDWIS